MVFFFSYGIFWFLCWCLTAYHLIMYSKTKAGKWQVEAWISGISGLVPLWNIFYGIKVVAVPFIESVKTNNWEYFK